MRGLDRGGGPLLGLPERVEALLGLPQGRVPVGVEAVHLGGGQLHRPVQQEPVGDPDLLAGRLAAQGVDLLGDGLPHEDQRVGGVLLLGRLQLGAFPPLRGLGQLALGVPDRGRGGVAGGREAGLQHVDQLLWLPGSQPVRGRGRRTPRPLPLDLLRHPRAPRSSAPPSHHRGRWRKSRTRGTAGE
ncbi:hypothetical protein [Ornithinimicrobium kibberense]|uniref:hypothetical protein n=1 Tax=Ornithinimicrobium kibberense TaxID=282060 RepID=UPI003623B313